MNRSRVGPPARPAGGAARLLSAGALLLLLGMAGLSSVEAGVPDVPCKQAQVFSGAALNVLVLPYRFSGSDEIGGSELERVGNELSGLLQLDILHSLLKYRSVGTVQLVQDQLDDPECDPQRVLRRVVGDDAQGGPEVRPGGGLILLWGRVFVRERELFLQSYTRFLRRGVEEAIEVQLPGEDRLRGRLSRTALPFAPRRVSRQELSALVDSARRADVLRSAASSDASVVHQLRAGQPYIVLDAEAGWMKVRVYETGKEGWLRARTENDSVDLRRLLPELAFLDGVAAYLRYRAGDAEWIGPASARTPSIARERLGWYVENAKEGTDDEAIAVGETLSAFVEILQAGGELDRLRTAAAAGPGFRRASRLLPQDADLRNLEALAAASAIASSTAPRESAQTVVDTLLDALALEPDNLAVVGNLESFYSFLLRLEPEQAPYSREELSERLETTRSVQNYLRVRQGISP